MYKVALIVVFINGIIIANAAPAIIYMTECERQVHTQCVMKISNSEKFIKQCNPKELLSCLKKYMTDEVCSINDADTLPTIQSLISSVQRKFEKDPKFCQKEQFVRYLQDHFTVQGEGIEFSEDYSGSGEDGDGAVVDDTERGEDDAEDTSDPAVKTGENSSSLEDDNTTAKKKNNGTDNKKNQNSVRKKSDYWKETSRRIMKGKNERRVQLLVYFDDPAQYKRNKERRQNRVSASLKKAWEKLKQRYQRWFLSSRFNKVS